MTEKEKNTSMDGGGEAPKDALSDVMQKLEISSEIKQKIQELQGEKKERCQLSLEDILTEVEKQELGPTDRNKKIQDTLESEYNIKTGTIDGKTKEIDKEVDEGAERFRILSEKLDTVKNLDKTIISDELTKAKTTEPIPEETKLAIAKSTNIDPTQVDEAIKKGDNPQINNLVDTYYLTSPKVQASIENRLPEEKKGEANIAFQELRGSAREFGVLSSFTPKSLPIELSDKSEKTKEAVIATFNSINKDNPDTRITRSGDTLSWEGANGKTYEIDMTIRPPQLSRKQNGLSIPYSPQEDNPERVRLQGEVVKSKEVLIKSKTEVEGSLKNAGIYSLDLDNLPIETVRSLFTDNDEFDTLYTKVKSAKSGQEQRDIQEEIGQKINITDGKLSKIGLQYLGYILEQKLEMGKLGSDEESVTEKDWKSKFENLIALKRSNKIENYVKSREETEKKIMELGKIKSPGVEGFDEDADDTFNTLITLGYHKLGQKGLSELIEALNHHNKGVEEPINLGDKTSLNEEQKKTLRSLSDKMLQRYQKSAQEKGKAIPTNYNELWQGVGNGLKWDFFRDTNWYPKERRAEYLFGDNKKSAT